MATNPSEKDPLRIAFRVVPTRSSSSSTTATVRTAPNFSGIWVKYSSYIQHPSHFPPMWKIVPTADATQTNTAVDHLTLPFRSQVGTPADDLAVLSPSAEQSTTLQDAQGKHAAFVCFDWP